MHAHLLLSLMLGALLATSAHASSPLSPEPTAPGVPTLVWEEVSRRPHDPDAFTQGLQLDGRGRLFESTGLRGSSSLREVDPRSGEVLRLWHVPDEHFAEGLALVGDELIQLTWQAGVARRFDTDTFRLTGRYRYDGEGWGLCYDGARLVMSDGSDHLTFRDPGTFEPIGGVDVSLAGEPLDLLNELECVDGAVWANVWLSDSIVRIDPADGRVTGLLDLRGLIEPDPAASESDAVLNGIAYDAAQGTFLLTGKRWPELIEIRVLEPMAEATLEPLAAAASSPEP